MKSIVQQIGACALAVLLLFSTLSFTVGLHYCGNHLVDVAINHEAEGCVMAMAPLTEDAGQDVLLCKPSPMPCCQDVQLTFDGHEDLQPVITVSSPQPFLALVSKIPASPRTSFDLGSVNSAYHDYFPPPLIRNIPILYQVFLI